MPDKETELLAYTVLNFVFLSMEVYKKPIPIQQYINQSKQPDFVFFVNGSIDNRLRFYQNEQYYFSGLQLVYNIDNKQFYIEASQLLSDPRMWETNGRISKIYDLSQVQAIIRYRNGMSWLDRPDIKKKADEIINHQFRVARVELNISGGFKYKFATNDFKQYNDKEGLPFYVITFPN